MPEPIDARGLRCPLPMLKAKHALERAAYGEVVIVLADDAEAPLDIAALASRDGHGFSQVALAGGGWEFRLTRAG